ncbi:hypothetical protein ABZ352_18455 [Streptomyces griseofuscus]|uniref:hypothetical protein n=1 Tax=Streptomyces griseofuscus TaxID=146922 RepID=UPI0033C5B943
MKLNRQTAERAAGEGRAAFAAGAQQADCPYDADGDAEQQFQHRYWSHAYGAAAEAAPSTGR